MTDLPGDPRRPDDELVSAVLDGEATPDERARVEADPVLRARLDEFAAVRDQVATPVAPRPGPARDAAIAAAVTEAAERREHTAKVVQLRRRQQVPRFLAAAAAVLLVVGGFGYLATQLDTAGDDSGDEAGGSDAAAPLEATDDTAAAGEAESLDDAAGGADGGTESATSEDQLALPELLSLPPVADEEELTEALRAEDLDPAPDDGFSESPPPSSVLPPGNLDVRGSSLECQQGLETTNSALSSLLVKATTDFAGIPAVVYVYGGAAGDRRVVVVADEACTPLADFQL